MPEPDAAIAKLPVYDLASFGILRYRERLIVAAATARERQRIREMAIWITTSSDTRERVVLVDLLGDDDA